MKLISLICIVFAMAYTFSQDQAVIDSLTLALRKAKTPEQKDEIINGLFNATVYNVPKDAEIYAEMERKLYESTGDKFYLSSAHNMYGTMYYMSNNMDSALYHFQQKVTSDLANGDTIESVMTLFNVAMIQTDLGLYEEALEGLFVVLETDISLKDTAAIISDYDLIGVQYQYMHDFTKAEKYYMIAYDLAIATGSVDVLDVVLVDISNLYREQLKFGKALEFLQKAYPIIMEEGNTQAIYTLKNNSALIYDEMGDVRRAIDTHLEAAQVAEETGVPDKKAVSYNNIGFIYMNMDEPDSAIMYLEPALEIKRELGSPKSICLTLSNLGNSYFKKKMYNKAMEYFDEGIQLSWDNNLPDSYSACKLYRASCLIELGRAKEALSEIKEALQVAEEYNVAENRITGKEILAKAYAGSDNYKDAYFTYLEFHAMADSVLNIEKLAAIAEADTKFETELKEQKIAVLDKENELKGVQLSREKEINKRKQQLIYAGIAGLVLLVLIGFLIYRAYQMSRRANRQLEEKNQVIQSQKMQVEEQHEQLVEKNKEIMDSITYARRIQSAILPPQKLVKEYLADSFILYKPKDIVAGDFYWMEQRDGNILFAAADCTGHGVPGAMVSVVCNNGLNRSVREYGLTDPGAILDKTREIVIQEFEKSEEEVKDGMDIALVSFGHSVRAESESLQNSNTTLTLKYAGAHNPLWIIRKGADDIEEIKASKQPIGKFDNPVPYETHTVELNKGDSIYIFSDGFADQFGGEKGKKFKASNFKKLLLSIQNLSITDQKQRIDDVFEQWKGQLEQLDDVCVIGVRV